MAQEVDVKVSKISIEDILFNKHDFNRSMDKIEVIDFHKTLEVNGIRFWCYTAGHVLGAAMLMVDIVFTLGFGKQPLILQMVTYLVTRRIDQIDPMDIG